MAVHDYVISTRLKLDPPNHGYAESLLYKKIELSSVCEAPKVATSLADGTNRPTIRPQGRYASTDLVSDLQFSLQGMFLASTIGGQLTLYDPLRGTSFNTLYNPMGENSILTRLVFTSEYKLATGDVHGNIASFDCRKFTEPLNMIRVHSQAIHSLLYEPLNNWLVSTDATGHIQWHFIPTFESKDSKLEKGFHYGSLFTSPVINQIALSNHLQFGDDVIFQSIPQKLVICSKNNGSLYIIDKLDLRHVAEDLKNVHIDDSLKVHLSLDPSLTLAGKRNRIMIIDQDELVPEIGTTISKFSQAQLIHLNTLLLKFTTKKQTLLGIETKDWIALMKIKESESGSLFFSPYGSGILEESLKFVTEEPRFYTLKEKKAGISSCNRVIASPHAKDIKLFSFSPYLQPFYNTQQWRRSCNSDYTMEMFSQIGLANLCTVKSLKVSKGYPLCCKFSPVTSSLLAVGDSEGQVLFYQPQL